MDISGLVEKCKEFRYNCYNAFNKKTAKKQKMTFHRPHEEHSWAGKLTF
jgi:hypothetical protein